jgi:hypothetical protein
MRQVGIFQVNTPSPVDGGFLDSYTTQLTTRGYMKKVGNDRSGSRTNSGGMLGFQNTYDWICRFQSGLTIDKKCRWVIDGKNYTIEGFEKIDMKNFYYRFRISEIS